MSENEKKDIEKFFDEVSHDFHSIYSGKKKGSIFYNKLIDAFFRRCIKNRFRYTFEECGNLRGKGVLDIGCGSGVYCVEFAKLGAKEVVGIDLSDNMLKIAGKIARKNKVEKICRFVKKDFMDYSAKKRFDITLAIGFFDYVKDPKNAVKKMKALTKNKMIMSFPVKMHLLSPQRKIRYWINGCPLYFYGKKKVRELLLSAGIKDYKIKNNGRDYFVVAKLGK